MYSAVNRRRLALATTSTSGTADRRTATSCWVLISHSLPALYPKLRRGECLTHVGTEGTSSRLTGITQGPQTAGLTYDAAHRRTTLSLPNGIVVEYAYDEASRLTGQTYTGPSGLLGDLTYSYDATGNRLGTGGSFARTLIPTAAATSTYNQANHQLAFGGTSQTFDANGNLLTQTDPSGTIAYTWDARNRLIGLSGPTVAASFSYDALGRRMSKTINGTTTAYHYDGLDAIRESGGGGDVAYLRTLAIDEALARTDASGTTAYLADLLGSSVALADATGSPNTTYTYAPFGETAVAGTPSANPVQFTGRENDGTGLYYYRARYYDPVRGRFVSEDPAGMKSGPNLFAYVAANPLAYVDPLGLYTEVIQWGPAPGWRSRWGHISGDINGQNWSFGPGGWDTHPSAEGYMTRQSDPDLNRGGRGVVLDLSPGEEAELTQCLASFANFNGILNNCGNPWVQCLSRMGIIDATDKARVLPYDVFRIISGSPRAIGTINYPGARLPVGVAR